MVAFKCCRLPTYSPKMPQVPSKPSCFKTPWLLLSAVGCQPTAPKCLKFPPNPGVSRPWLLLSAVGCQPTAPKCINKPSCFKTMVAFKCCMLPTYSPNRLPTYSPKCLKFPPNPGVSRPWLLLSAVGCQPTAPKCLQMPQVPSKPSCFKTPMVAFKCCRLPTYSPKMPQVPSKPSCFKTMVAFKCCRLPTYSPKMPQVPSKPVFQDHGCF